jgi:enoyl-CoA hydratase/carnithine racemase
MLKNNAITLDVTDGVASLVVKRPPVNAFNDVLIDAFNQALTRVEESSELSVLHIKSGLGVFSAGDQPSPPGG